MSNKHSEEAQRFFELGRIGKTQTFLKMLEGIREQGIREGFEKAREKKFARAAPYGYKYKSSVNAYADVEEVIKELKLDKEKQDE